MPKVVDNDSFRPTGGRVPLTARPAAARLWWAGTTANGGPPAVPNEQTNDRGQMGHYQRPLLQRRELVVDARIFLRLFVLLLLLMRQEGPIGLKGVCRCK